MRRRRSSPPRFDEWPPHLRMLIRAAERECPNGHAGTLMELMSLALTKVPARGIFDPTAGGEHALFAALETIARRHLGMAEARAAWHKALHKADLELEVRDTIEHAALRVQGVSDTVYFYAGLAFGLTCGSIYRASS
jgi:hypothetical protein